MAQDVIQTREEVASQFKTHDLDNGPYLCLYKSTFVPAETSTKTDFLANEVVFTGYAPFQMSGGFLMGLTPGNDVQLISVIPAIFTQTATTASDIAGGWFMVDDHTSPTKLEGSGAFVAPFSFNKVGNTVSVNTKQIVSLDSDADVETLVGP